MIGSDPDVFYEHQLVGWGATSIDRFDQKMPTELTGPAQLSELASPLAGCGALGDGGARGSWRAAPPKAC